MILTTELRDGIGIGVVMLALGLPIGLAWRVARRAPAPVAGVLIAVGAVAGLARTVVAPTQPDPLPGGLVAGLAILAVAGLVSASRYRVVGVALAAAGAIEIAMRTGLPTATWTRALVALVVPMAGAALASFDSRWRDAGAGPVLYAASMAGVFATVPETLHASIVLGVAATVALLGASRLAGLGSAGAYAAAGLLVWTASIGGAARPSSIVGGLGCLGLLLVDPAARALAGGRAPWDVVAPRWRTASLTAIQLPLVAVASRVAGMQRSAGSAALVVAAEVGVALAAQVRWARAMSSTGVRLERGVGDGAAVVRDRV